MLSVRLASLLVLLAGLAHAVEVQLQAPLTTLVRCTGTVPTGEIEITATVTVPAGAPADLGIGAFVGDRHGSWFQRLLPRPLAAGRWQLRFRFGPDAPPMAEPDRGQWTASDGALLAQAGLLCWSASAARTAITVEDLVATAVPASDTGSEPESASAPPVPQLCDLELDGMDGLTASARAVTGQRWSLRVRPEPFPVNPYDSEQFTLDAVLTGPDGKELRVPGFARQPMRLSDRGDREDATPEGAIGYEVRFRPREPGTYRLRLEARWAASGQEPAGSVTTALPDLLVGGEPWDGYLRVDREDPRFFTVDGQFHWLVGLNLHSTFDQRSRERLGTRLTPARGTLAYGPRFKRLAAAGMNACEIWMAAWNTALEWRGDWPGYGGIKRYNQANAERMDRILDLAWAEGIRINVVVNNHGQAAPSEDREWKNNPWNRAVGGPLKEPIELFNTEIAAKGQANLRRYLVARYADHPAVLGWKIYSEINLTAMGDSQRGSLRIMAKDLPPLLSDEARRNVGKTWHEGAAAHLHAIDIYGHGVTTHWSGDWHKPDRAICALPGIDYICIDAYHQTRRRRGEGTVLAHLIYDGMQDPNEGLGKHGKPLWVTEYGGASQASADTQLRAEVLSAAWAAMAGGNAGAPMTWWFEWIEEKALWQPFGAIGRFLKGEDLRGKIARGVVLEGASPAGVLWVRAWTRPGRMLGYVMDDEWGALGEAQPVHDHAQVMIGSQVSAGPCQVQWWDADEGRLVHSDEFNHPGGALRLSPPAFKKHIAFKLVRAVAGGSP